MASLEAVSSTVKLALADGRIGTPLFTRIVVHTLEDHGRVEALLAAALETAGGWLDDKIIRLAALGGVASGQVTVLALFKRGQTALISAGTRGTSPPMLEAVVVGNHGVLSWEPGPTSGRTAGAATEDAAAGDYGRRLLAAAKASAAEKVAIEVDADGNIARRVPSQEVGPRPADRPAARLKPSKPPFGLLLIGGNQTHQENYARSLAGDDRCRLIAVTDDPGVDARRRKLNEALATELKIPHLADYREALTREDVDLVSICAEPDRRGPIIVRCADAGKHVYLDKPLCASLNEATKIVDAVRGAGVVSQMFTLVRTDASARLREAIRTKQLGDPTALHFDLMFAKGYTGGAKLGRPRAEERVPKSFETIDAKRELSNVGVYPLALLHWLTGRRVRRVFATTGNYFFAEHQKQNMEDFGAALMELDDGRVATLAAGRPGWRSHPSGGLNRNYVIGTEGVASIDLYRPHLAVWSDDEPWQPPRRNADDPHGFWSSTNAAAGAKPKDDWLTPPQPTDAKGRNEFKYFLDCIEQGRQSDLSADVAAETTRVLLAAYASAATGGVANLS